MSITQTEGIIHLAALRVETTTDIFRSQVTLPHHTTEIKSNLLLKNINRFADNTLAPAEKVLVVAPEACFYVAIPLVGALDFETLPNKPIVASGECFIKELKTGDQLVLANPYPEDYINYLEIFFKANFLGNQFSENIEFNLDNHKNELIELVFDSQKGNGIFMGKFDSRAEYLIQSDTEFNGFLFVINGSYEAQGRLLDNRDAVSLIAMKELDFEALSHESIILFIRES